MPLLITMAWRFGNYNFVKEGRLNNKRDGFTFGEIEFASIGRVRLELSGNMQGGLAGKALRFANPDYDPDCVFDHGGGRKSDAGTYMEHFHPLQKGEVGDIFGEPYLHIEWHSGANGRCVIELAQADYEIEP